jgi:S-methylmethionine-dependent homocysteine/selenocysteine methylase
MTYRDRLPQLDGTVFLTDGGLETVLVFHEGLELPLFAAFDLLKDDAGTELLRSYYETYVAHVRTHHPERTPMSCEEFTQQRLADKYSRPGSRCC